MSRATSPGSDGRSKERGERVADRALERRLWSDHPGARRVLGVATGLSFAGTVCWTAIALLLSDVVAKVFLDGARLDAIDATIAAMVGLVAARGALLWSSEVVAQRAAEVMKTGLRERLGAKLAELGPTYTSGERAGELVHTAGEGVEALDAYVTRFRPARALAAIVPAAVALVVFALDPWTVTILVVTGPVLVLLLSLIGRRVRDQTRRRERELAWMNAHFLDVLRGLTTLKLFGRSAEQAEAIEEVGRRYGASTMDVLRTAFQTTLVLEWGATAATALVAIETSVRLMAGGLAFELALAVLLLTPEFFLPLRRLAAEYHAGRAGTAAASRIYEILDEPVRLPKDSGRASPPGRFDVRFADVHVSFDGGSRRALADARSTSRRGAWWRSSVRPARGRPRSRTCCCASWSPSADRYSWEAGGSTEWTPSGGESGSRSSRSTRTCSTGRSPRTSASRRRPPPTRSSRSRRRRHTRTRSSNG